MRKKFQNQKKATYAILTAFMFVIISIVLILGVIYYEVFITEMENMTKDDLNKYKIVKDARNKILFCYGNIIDTNKYTEDCDIPIILGYSITRLERQDCEYNYFNSTNVTHYDQKFSYFVPVRQSGTICLGEMEIFT
jgi:hypothetical protein